MGATIRNRYGVPARAGVAITFVEDLRAWVVQDDKTALGAFAPIDASWSSPFAGIDRTGPLKHLLRWARSHRLTQEHGIVYLVQANRIGVLQAGYHR